MLRRVFLRARLLGLRVRRVRLCVCRRDYMAHHPFHSFTRNVIKFIETAANDPKVLAIKITLYRTGRNSQLLDALKLAVHKGKQVTAYIEMKARFDEETNIIWANE